MSGINRKVVALSKWVDVGMLDVGIVGREATWNRLGKLAEESGEVIDAFIGATGGNPRKGKCKDMVDVKTEILDVAAGGLFALAHVYGNSSGVDYVRMLEEHIDYLLDRAGVQL